MTGMIAIALLLTLWTAAWFAAGLALGYRLGFRAGRIQGGDDAAALIFGDPAARPRRKGD